VECVAKKSLEHCSCTYTGCEKRGHCCECVTYHRTRNEMPGCFFSLEGERSYDRSLEHFLRDRKGYKA